MKAHFILYVNDQADAAEFYAKTLGHSPRLNVPGMTEFDIGDDAVLGLMPFDSASRLLGQDLIADKRSSACAEIYLIVDDPAEYHSRAIAAGAVEISPLELRDWGHEAAYSADPFGTVLAFAREI